MPQGGNLDQWGLGAGQQLLLPCIKLTVMKYILHGNSESQQAQGPIAHSDD